ncbi:sentrin-specific protease 1-like [Olea europaea subsp. europaea]|uniref:Sentrin-specific protease 1-like n=1 Tax=Olea europaea subsp. europaea TaxID=158383 RepID=A0A8S0UNA1_OLEEU|nr:sentrin-specific protease 1-like [Olea europaea subsp. europaea]
MRSGFQLEFSLITGLRASEESSLEPHIVTNDRLVKKHFKKCKKGITVHNLKEAIESRKEADLPRICRWNSSEMPNYKDIGASMDEPNIVVHCTLKPTSEEASKAYWTEIHRFEDEVEDPTVDIFVDKENVADSSIRVDLPQQTCHSPNASTSPREPSSFHRPPTSTDAYTFHPGPSTSYPSLYPSRDEFAQELRMQLLQMVEILERKNEGRIDEMRSYIDQRFDCVTSFCRQIDEKISSVVEWMKNSNPSTTPYTYHSPLRSGFMNTGEACDVNEDPLVHVEVQNDENQDDNEEREVEDYVLANEPVIVKEATLPAYGNEQKQADDMNNCPNPIEVENEQRQATDLPNDDETRVEERDTCVPMDSIAHGDVMESIPIVVEDESDKSSQIGRGMRIKKRSLVLESPFTNPEKRRKLRNVNAFDPFRELDPAKADDLQNWLVNAPDSEHVDIMMFTKPKSFFLEIQKQFGWLDSDHIDIALLLMRARMHTYPTVFPQDCAILDCAFTNMCTKRFEDFELHKKEKNPVEDFKWMKNMTRYIYGKNPEWSKRWDSCTSLYIPCNVEMKHWIALKVDFAERTIYVYDSMKSLTRFGKLQKIMHPIVKVIPRMMKESLLFGENYPHKQFLWRRHADVPQQNNAGDCGMYVIKFIELLSAGLDVKLISDTMIDSWRKKLAAEIFAMHFDP